MYTLKYKKQGSWFWKSVKVTGHRYERGSDHMDIFKVNGDILSIGNWKQHDLMLDDEWIKHTDELAEKDKEEKELEKKKRQEAAQIEQPIKEA